MSDENTKGNKRSPIRTRRVARLNSQRTESEGSDSETKENRASETDEAKARRKKIAEEQADVERKIQQIKEEEELHKRLQAEKKVKQAEAKQKLKEQKEKEELHKKLQAEEKAKQVEAEQKLKEQQEKEELHKKLQAEEKAKQVEAEQKRKEQQEKEELLKKLQAEEEAKQAEAEQKLKEQKEEEEKKHRQQDYKTNPNKMNQQQIQQQIASFVPEFSGEDTINQSSQIKRFLGTSKSIYNELNSDEERAIFNKLIKFRLTGDAYTRIQDTEVKDYTELATILQNMYTRTYSLNELEKQYMETQQTYGETIRNYGYRLSEALNKYKNAFKLKYTIGNIGEAYNTHLQENSVQLFKRGLNNTILKEKIATSTAKTLEEVIEETETIEKMLAATTGTTGLQPLQPLPQWPTHNLRPKSPVKTIPIICNYCQKLNHTWDKCRTRIYAETRNQRNSYYRTNNFTNNYPNPQTKPFENFNQTYQQPNFFSVNRPQIQHPNHYFPQHKQTYNQNNIPDNYIPPHQNPNFNNYNTSQRPNVRIYQQPKHCSHCKTTTSHTFDECRSKFFSNPNQSQRNPNEAAIQRKSDTENLVENFKGLRINRLAPQQPNNSNEQYTPEQPQYSENPNGSSQP